MINRNELTDRADLVMNSFAFEFVFDEDFGKRKILVTDCLDENNKAVFFAQGNDLTEKVSGFSDEIRYKELKDVIAINKELILEEFNERKM